MPDKSTNNVNGVSRRVRQSTSHMHLRSPKAVLLRLAVLAVVVVLFNTELHKAH